MPFFQRGQSCNLNAKFVCLGHKKAALTKAKAAL